MSSFKFIPFTYKKEPLNGIRHAGRYFEQVERVSSKGKVFKAWLFTSKERVIENYIKEELRAPKELVDYLKDNWKPTEELPTVQRLQLARNYYAKEEKEKKGTPTPFTEFRVYKYSILKKIPSDFDGELDDLEKTASALANRDNDRWLNSVYSIDAKEEERVDFDEIESFEKFSRYMVFFNRDGSVKGEYDEEDISKFQRNLKYYGV